MKQRIAELEQTDPDALPEALAAWQELVQLEQAIIKAEGKQV